MAKVLIAWELGGGLGHLAPLVPIVERLGESGHRVVAVVRDLSRVDRLFGDADVTFLQAPFKTSKNPDQIKEPRSFAHILSNNGFGDVGELRGLAGGWRGLFELIRPDLIICDHAPIALLASRACGARRVVMGTGFCCPPDVHPLPDFRPWLPDAAEQLRRDEDAVLQNANALLDSWQLEPLNRISQLYRDVQATFLTTYPELDHYPDRGRVEYYGTWLTPGGTAPPWPAASGQRIFAYLKPFKALADLLEVIQQTGLPALIYADGITPSLRERFETPAMQFVSERLDLAAVGATCDLAILNGGHNATCLMLLTGKPVMTVPLNLEQAYNGSSVARLDAGFGAFAEDPKAFGPTLKKLLATDKFSRGAERFAARYANMDPDQQIQRVVDRLAHIAESA